jgi:hypothetical protein
MNQIQTDLFQASPALPEGFRYHPDFLSAHEERDLVERFANLPFKEFEFRGYRGNRRVLSFGWQYDFNRWNCREPRTCRSSCFRCGIALPASLARKLCGTGPRQPPWSARSSGSLVAVSHAGSCRQPVEPPLP